MNTIKEEDYLSDVKINHFKMIKDYNMLKSLPEARDKAIYNTLLKKYSNISTYNSMKQTFAKLKRKYPERFNINKAL